MLISAQEYDAEKLLAGRIWMSWGSPGSVANRLGFGGSQRFGRFPKLRVGDVVKQGPDWSIGKFAAPHGVICLITATNHWVGFSSDSPPKAAYLHS